MNPSIVRIIVGILAALGYLVGAWGFTSPAWLAVITLALLVYVAYEIYIVAVIEREARWLTKAPVMASLYVFGLTYGITNITLFTPEGGEAMDWFGVDYTWLIRTEALALLGALFMWMGYRSRIGLWAGKRLSSSFRLDRFFSKSWEVRWSIIWLCVLMSFGARLVMIQLGAFGYNADMEELEGEGASYHQYLGLLTHLGSLALAALAIHCAGSKSTTNTAIIALSGIMIYEMIFGVIAGFKSHVILPPLIITTCYYTVRGKIHWVWVAAVAASVPIAYTFVEPLRRARNEDPRYDNRSLVSIMSFVVESINFDEIGNEEDKNKKSPFYSAFDRLSITLFSAMAIRFDETVGLDEDDPNFLMDLLLRPVYSVIPRFAWTDKPLSNAGIWFTRTVCGQITSNSGTGFGPVGHLYFVGGVVGVCLGFMVIGFLQRFVYQTFWRASAGSLLVYLIIAGSMACTAGTLDNMISFLIRSMPMLVVAQYFLFKNT